MMFDNYDFKNNRDGFSPAMAALMIFVDGESYISIFKEHNIGVNDLCELSELDLILLGVDCLNTRARIINAVEHFPVELKSKRAQVKIKAENIEQILNHNVSHLHRICVGVMANRISLIKTKDIQDMLLPYSTEFYATDLIMHTLKEMERLLDNIEQNLININNIKSPQKVKKSSKKKIIATIVGGIAITVLSVGFIRSIHQLL